MYQLHKGTKMTLKQKAVLQTLGIFAAMLASSLLLNLILFYTPAQVLLYLLGIGLVGLMFYAVYGVVLSRLEYNSKLDEINSKT